MNIIWLETANKDIQDIYDYIAKSSEQNAGRQVDRITARTKQIREFPKSGRVVPEFHDESIRELIEGHYRIIYKIHPTRIFILSIYHTSRLLK